MSTSSIILTVLLIILIPGAFVLAWYLDEEKEKKYLKLFKPGMIIEYYTHCRHGKFRQEKFLYGVTIKDVDGKYALVTDGKRESELNLPFEMKYSDKMVLKNSDGTIIKEFGFEV